MIDICFEMRSCVPMQHAHMIIAQSLPGMDAVM